MKKAGILICEMGAKRKIADKSHRMVELAVDAADALALTEPKRRSAPARYEVVCLLATAGRTAAAEICYYTGASQRTLKAMEKAGLIAFSEEEELRVPEVGEVEPGKPIRLNEEQERAFSDIWKRIRSGKPSVTLLQGVTGSGKTEVYLRLVQETLAMGKTAIVLVPEIVLTPQMMRKFTSYFGNKVVMLHSSLRMTERYDQWKRICRGEVDVVLGTRSALFAPLKNLGLIIMDEEQEHTYRSESAPRYSAHEVARQRAAEKPNGSKNKKHKFLDTYCQNLTQKARDGKLDRIVGRDVETERVVQILNRRQKNNPCLIGEPGVGKTAIAEGLAQRIVDKEVPYKLQGKEVYLMDLTALVAGTQFRGQFESRMKSLIDEVKKLGNIILVIDEVHNLVGAGDAEGSMNAANILKPALSRGEIQVIGATTFDEYRKYIEKDSALERRFQPVTVNEPTIEESIAILRGISHYYEEFHGVEIPPEIARQTVILSERYITDRFLPDKAIDLLDEACSDVNLKNKSIGKLEALKKDQADIELELGALMDQPDKADADFARMAELRSRKLQLEKEIAVLEEEPKPVLTMENLARIIELWTKIPASKIRAQEYEQLENLDTRLKEHIVGQDEAIRAVTAAIRRNRVGISPKKRPVSFIFVGSTGVGKTELVKCLANEMFESVESLIRLDMSEYMEKHSVSKLIGSPPGYVGYDEAGQLTEKIRVFRHSL